MGEESGVFVVNDWFDIDVILLFRTLCGNGEKRGDNVKLRTEADGDSGNGNEIGESSSGIYGREGATVGKKGGVGNCSLDIIVPRVVGRRASLSSSSSDNRSEYGS